MDRCPVCQGLFGGDASVVTAHSGYRVDCENCGKFALMEEAFEDFLDPQSAPGSRLSEADRARLAHRVRTSSHKSSSWVKIYSNFVERFISDGCPGPNPAQQATNIIRIIGNEVGRTGKKLEVFPENFFSEIGSPSPEFAADLTFELIRQGLVSGSEYQTINGPDTAIDVGLTLNGWQSYQAERTGQSSGNYGFAALKFGDGVLDPLLQDHIKPMIEKELGFDVVDMRDVSQAGVIDNIMRAQIRDSAFVIVDLTHDNSGAYWEAGYAEGLGKPVVYICERAKFDDAKTHFDTNHCTTVIWSSDDPHAFCRELIATLRRSLNLFAGAKASGG